MRSLRKVLALAASAPETLDGRNHHRSPVSDDAWLKNRDQRAGVRAARYLRVVGPLIHLARERCYRFGRRHGGLLCDSPCLCLPFVRYLLLASRGTLVPPLAPST